MDIEKFRTEIDSIDQEIIRLLNRRCELGRQIGAWKHENRMPIYVPERERQLLDQLTAANPGPLDRESLLAIYREIMSAAIKLERPISIAYMGPQGTFSHLAVLEKFGRGAVAQPESAISDVFRAVESGRADYGMVPVENTTEGVVNPTLDSLISSNVKAVAEFNLPIHLFLYSSGPIEEIRCIYSHPQPFGQCREYLQTHLRHATLIEVASTARAMELAERESDAAAIAGAMAREHSELPCIAENIEDNSRNITRFLVIGRQENQPSGDDKTSLCFVLHDRVGALYDALRPFRDHNITMTMIESRPLKSGNWEYCFFVDLLGHQNDPGVMAACAKLRQDCAMFKLFGSYPRVIQP